MANALDLLLGGKVKADRPTKEVKLPRLSGDDTDFILTAVAVTMDDFKHVQETNKKGKELDEIGMNLMLLTYGIKEFDGRLAENKERIAEIKKSYGVPNMEKFINKLLLPGEIAMLAMAITEVSGFGEDMVEAVKKELAPTQRRRLLTIYIRSITCCRRYTTHCQRAKKWFCMPSSFKIWMREKRRTRPMPKRRKKAFSARRCWANGGALRRPLFNIYTRCAGKR